MITIDDLKENKKNYFLGTILTILVIFIIVFLMIIYYFVLTDSVSVLTRYIPAVIMDNIPNTVKSYFLSEEIKIDNNIVPEQQKNEPIVVEKKIESNATKVIKYAFPTTLPKEIKEGSCQEYSKAEPYRQDAFLCTVDKITYDPCFSNTERDKVVCQMNPLSQDIFVINLKTPLPEAKLPVTLKTNWAWFLELEDGTICSPYTGSKPLVGNAEAFYGCKAKIKGDLDVLIGDLIDGETWTARRMIGIKVPAGTGWDTKFSGIVKIKNIWR